MDTNTSDPNQPSGTGSIHPRTEDAVSNASRLVFPPVRAQYHPAPGSLLRAALRPDSPAGERSSPRRSYPSPDPDEYINPDFDDYLDGVEDVPDPVLDPEDVYNRQQEAELRQSQATETGYSEIRSMVYRNVDSDLDSDATIDMNYPSSSSRHCSAESPTNSLREPDEVVVDAILPHTACSTGHLPTLPPSTKSKKTVRPRDTARRSSPDQETVDLSSSETGPSDSSSSESELERITFVTVTSRRKKVETWLRFVSYRPRPAVSESESESESEREEERRHRRNKKGKKRMKRQQKKK